MATQRRRVKAGDVLELRIGDRFAYLLFIGKHPEYGHAVVVKPQLQERPQVVSAEHFSDGYVTFYPVAAALAQGLVNVVAHMSPPKVPTRFRRFGARLGRHIDTWIIETGSGDIVKSKLSDEELRLPVAAIWNHEFLVQRIAEGWHPEQEGREA
jgi:hypothetical protein